MRRAGRRHAMLSGMLVLFCSSWETHAVMAANWKDLKVIDVHAHIGDFRGYDLRASTLLDNIQRYGVRMTLVSNIDGAELPGITQNRKQKETNEIMAGLVEKHPDVLRGLVWTRPEDGTAAEVETFLRDRKDRSGRPLFVGMKFHPEFNNIAADDKKLDPYMMLCERYKTPAVFHCGARGNASDPRKIYALAKRHKSVDVVLYHMGMGTDNEYAIAVAVESIKNGDASLYLETSQVPPNMVLKAIKAVGADRVLFGTDATYFGKNHYKEYEQLIESMRKSLPKPDLDKVLHKNAERIFKLPP